MYEYKTEKIILSFKFVEGEYIKDKDLEMMDEVFNSNQNEGWELVTYDYLRADNRIKESAVILATFRRKK